MSEWTVVILMGGVVALLGMEDGSREDGIDHSVFNSVIIYISILLILKFIQ